MNPTPLSFTELKRTVSHAMSQSFEMEGFSPLVGRIFGLLLFASEPVSLQSMAEQLGVSKAAVSVQVRTLERNSMCQKVTASSDRKDYYYIADDVNAIALRSTKQKMDLLTQQVESTLCAMNALTDIAPEDRDAYLAAKRRFTESVAMYGLLSSKLEGLEEEWLAVRQKLYEEQDGKM
ncbi:DNA-binding transcriptional regulator GbsR, MarR family [Paenibacillus sp. UNCCL117]|uniref:GbsR/MarR family transcriptional regulator n=1 Tax=unclassified Paenibacillus TaxID=185978 RepID=UPI000884C4D8|nr:MULTISPECIES: MarR family transcriptional regulator [unclassified Paenibacillus]SDC76508.1 DNA-binding transcriptional regulator GbsR, MarR family [Paenibacillus sp. cl123]SFW25604.1 DNA-binding transcriptional regulator GbsR, MarR family [Paenibacillus sp. UNCCL117]